MIKDLFYTSVYSTAELVQTRKNVFFIYINFIRNIIDLSNVFLSQHKCYRIHYTVKTFFGALFGKV